MRHVLPDGLDTMLPGPELASALGGVDRSELNGYELVILARAERRQVSFYEASSFETVTELAHCPPGFAGSPPERVAVIDEFAADEFRPAFGWTRRAAESFFALALDVVEGFPIVLSGMKEGRIDRPKAGVIVKTLSHLETRHIQKITATSLSDAAEKTTGEIGAMLRREAIACDPESAKKSYHRGIKERYVALSSNSDGTANISAYNLPVLAANRVMKRINEIAISARHPEETRRIDQIRADVFLDLLSGRRRYGPPSDRPIRRRRSVVDIRVDLTTLAGLDESPAEIPGWGPVIADIARQAADPDNVWQATVVDENGAVVTVATTRRRPTIRQRREITAENPTCAFPGCRMPSSQSDIDHNDPWALGGKTERENLGPSCRHDHNLKTEGGWELEKLDPTGFLWTSPRGHSYITRSRPPP